MILLNIYITTIIFAIVSLVLLSIETNLYCREHGIIVAVKHTLGRRIFDWVKIFIQCCIPLWNIWLGICYLVAVFSEKFMEQITKDNIVKGKLKYKDEGE